MQSDVLLSWMCKECGRRMFAASQPTCRCGGRAEAYEQAVATRSEIVSRMEICKQCDHYGLHQRNGQTFEGCNLLAKPCSVEQKRMIRGWSGPNHKKCWSTE